MEFTATAKYIRTSPRKLRLIVDSIKNLPPKVALGKLAMIANRAKKPLADTLSSAIANANDKKADVNTLKFAAIEVMEGGSMKRWHAVSRGQAHAYKRSMSHIRVVLTDEGGRH